MTEDPIDQAYRRCQIFVRMLKQYRNLPRFSDNRRWIELGIVGEGEKKRDALQKIDTTLDELESLIKHVTILDMAAALESAARIKLGNAIGDVRKACEVGDKLNKLPRYSGRLIVETSSFEGLKSLADLLDGYIDMDIHRGFKASRDARNQYAHGTDVGVPPSIDTEKARDYFKKILEIIRER